EVDKQKEMTLSVDLTNVKTSKSLTDLEQMIASYELEIDLSSRAKSLPKKYLDLVLAQITRSIKLIEQSNYVVTNTIKAQVVAGYGSVLNVETNKLAARQTVTLEVQHVVDKLPNKYAVTDKADG